MIGLAWVLACAPEDRVSRPLPPGPIGPRFRERPTLTLVDPDAPLGRRLAWTSTEAASATVRWTDGTDVVEVEVAPTVSAEVPVLRLRPDRDVFVTVTLHGPGGASTSLATHTASLPARFADIEVRTMDEARRQPGDTLLGVGSADVVPFQVVLTPEGEVVWWYEYHPRVMEMQLQPDGYLLGLEDDAGPFRMDWLGRKVAHWMPADRAGEGDIPIDLTFFHHDTQQLPDGTLVLLSKRNERVDDFPTSYDDPTARADDQLVRSDRAVLVDPADGTILRELPLSDAIPYQRIGYGSLGGNVNDWVHANSASPAPDVDGLAVSSRHQDAVVGYALDGTVRWILANPANWTPASEALRLQPVGEPFAWPYKQHAAKWIEGDRVLLFDNGNDRASPWTGEEKVPNADNASRVVEYRIDEQARTVEQLWSFEVPGTRLFVDYHGDADLLPNGNVLADFASVVMQDGRPLGARGKGAHLIRLVEFVRGTDEVVWDVEISSRPADAPAGWSSFRAQRLPVGWETGAVPTP